MEISSSSHLCYSRQVHATNGHHGMDAVAWVVVKEPTVSEATKLQNDMGGKCHMTWKLRVYLGSHKGFRDSNYGTIRNAVTCIIYYCYTSPSNFQLWVALWRLPSLCATPLPMLSSIPGSWTCPRPPHSHPKLLLGSFRNTMVLTKRNKILLSSIYPSYGLWQTTSGSLKTIQHLALG